MGKVFVVDPDSKKLPMELTVVVGMCAFLDFFCMNQIMPNVPFMVADYFPDIDTNEIGYYSGYLTSCYNLGGIVGNLFWGWFSDSYGRKPTIVISLLGTAIFCQLFGLAPNYTLAIVFRTCWGLMNSMLGVVKTYIAEMCNAHTVAKGFSIMSAAGGLARIVGPLVGGFLSKPEENFPSLVHLMPWLRKVRYWIPCFVGGVLCLFTAIFTAFAAPETLPREAAKKAKEDKKRNAMKVVGINKRLEKGEKISLEEEMLIELSRDNYFDLVRNKYVVISCISYALVSFVQSAQDSLLSLYLINDYKHGGFGFDQTDIGWLYTGIGPIQIIFNPLIYPLVAQLLNYQDIYFWSGTIYAILLLFYPSISLFNTTAIPIRWFVVLIATMSCIFSRLINFTTSNVLINNSAYADYRGKVNGLGQVLAAVGRFAGPSIGSNIFAWSISEDRPFPFNFGFTYYTLGIMMIGVAFIVYLLPKSINNPKGRIADAYKKKGQELKEISEMKEITNSSEEKVVDCNEKTPSEEEKKMPGEKEEANPTSQINS